MKVDRVKATVRYSQDSGKGAWRALELGAEASLDPGETLEQGQAKLYEALRLQFKAFWNSGPNGHSEADPQLPLASSPVAEPEQDEEPEEHWCEEHQEKFWRREKEGRVWYSHAIGNGQYCHERG